MINRLKDCLREIRIVYYGFLCRMLRKLELHTWVRMKLEIGKRSPDQIRRMEQRRGLG